MADACGAVPRIIDQVDGPLGRGHVTQHEPLAVMCDAVTTACTERQQQWMNVRMRKVETALPPQ
jgi:hypothetical protein